MPLDVFAVLMVLALFATGFTASFMGVLVGIGGGFLAVPVLLFLGFTPQEASGTSLLMVMTSSAMGTLSYVRQGRVDYGLALRFGLAAVPGAVLGANVVKLLAPPIFSSAFGIILLTVSLYMIFKPRRSEPARHAGRRSSWLIYPLAFSIGVLAATFGIGGGTIQVPAMILLLSVPTHIATATSMFIIVLCASSGAAAHIIVGRPVFWAAAALAAGTLVGAPLSAKLSKGVKSRTLQKILAAIIFAVGVRLLLQGLMAVG